MRQTLRRIYHHLGLVVGLALAITNSLAAPVDTGDARLPFLRIPRAAKPPVMDGTIHDGEWAGATRLTNFVHTNTGALAQEQTTLWLTYDATQLLLAFRMNAFCLDPVSNMTAAFKATHRKQDEKVWEDDSVEFRLERWGEPPTTNYYLAFNANAAVLDMAHRGTWDRAWDAGATVRARRDDAGFWEAEIALPLANVSGDATVGTAWRFMCTRFEQRLGERTSWTRLVRGDHTNPANAGYIVLGGASTAVEVLPLTEATLAKGAIPGAVHAPAPTAIAWQTGLYQQSKLRFIRDGTIAATAAETPFTATVDVGGIRRSGAESFQLCLSQPQVGLLYRSGRLPLPSGSATATLTAHANAPLDIYWNGEKVSANVADVDALKLKLQPGANLVAVRGPVGVELAGVLECAGGRFPIDTTWRAAINPPDGSGRFRMKK